MVFLIMNQYERKDEMINSTYSTAEAVMYGRFIKYTQLGKLCTLEFPKPPKEVNVFIDLSLIHI